MDVVVGVASMHLGPISANYRYIFDNEFECCSVCCGGRCGDGASFGAAGSSVVNVPSRPDRPTMVGVCGGVVVGGAMMVKARKRDGM